MVNLAKPKLFEAPFSKEGWPYSVVECWLTHRREDVRSVRSVYQ
jgi:hypothetical protein